MMSKIWQKTKQFSGSEAGASMVEYGLLAALISVAAVTVLITVGLYVNGAFTAVDAEIKKSAVTP